MKYSYSILIIIIFIIGIVIFNSFTKSTVINGFQNNTRWPPDLIKRFNIYQQTVSLNKAQYDLNILQKQASIEEVEQFLETGYWPWPDSLKKEYIDKVWSNTMLKIDPAYSLQYSMKLYNQNAAREILAWNTKEGHFLLYGADLGVTDGMPKNVHNTLKCSTDSQGNSIMEKKVYKSMDFWNGYFNINTTIIKPDDIPKEMKGFSFVNGPCNPCEALDYPPNYTCPFKINKYGDDSISSPWKQLWGL